MTFRLISLASLVLVIGMPFRADGQDVEAQVQLCSGYCSMFERVIAQAESSGDSYSIEKLKSDLQRMDALTEQERGHIQLRADLAIASLSKHFQIQTRQEAPSGLYPLNAVSEVDREGSSPVDNQSPDEGAVSADPATAPEAPANDADPQAPPPVEQAERAEIAVIQAELQRRLAPKVNGLRASNAVRFEAAPEGELPATGVSNDELRLAPESAAAFGQHYRRIRNRYLDWFFFEGISAAALEMKSDSAPIELSVNNVHSVTFADQTLHMGQAMLLFAGESKVLRDKGLPYEASEAAISKLLVAFDALDESDVAVYHSSRPGFFLRDDITAENRRGIPGDWGIKSDMKGALDGNPGQAAMSIDQTTSLFVGWWAITQWSGSADNRRVAKRQLSTVMDYLVEAKFFISRPDGVEIPADRGPDFRFAAGFLCRIARQALGEDYFPRANISLFSIKGDPITVRDDFLSEFTLPGYEIPAELPVRISHVAVMALTPISLVVMTGPPTVTVTIREMIPGMPQSMTLPCAHIEQLHPAGDPVSLPCLHMVTAHPGGHAGPKTPCIHFVSVHPDGDPIKCLHMTAKHPGGDPGPRVVCTHLKQEHSSDWIEKTVRIGGFSKKIKVEVPCTHFVKEHPGGHAGPKIPCTHFVPKHPNGHTIPCVHKKAAHPAGDPTTIPCVHLTPAHPDGHESSTPCVHFGPAHSGGHGFDTNSLSREVPLGDAVAAYVRHIVLQSIAFEPLPNAPLEFLPAALNSNHVWAALLRAKAIGDIPLVLIDGEARASHRAIPSADGPSNIAGGEWVKTNRWERCNDLVPDEGAVEAYNGVDFMSLEVLMRLNGVL